QDTVNVEISLTSRYLALASRGRYSSSRDQRTAAAMTVAAHPDSRERLVARRAQRAPGASLALLGALVALVAFAAVSAPGRVSAQPSAPVVVAHLDGDIDPLTAEYVHRVLSAAADQHASLVVLTIDTPGGLDSSMRQTVQDMLNSPVPTVVYVSPPGARAASA